MISSLMPIQNYSPVLFHWRRHTLLGITKQYSFYVCKNINSLQTMYRQEAPQDAAGHFQPHDTCHTYSMQGVENLLIQWI